MGRVENVEEILQIPLAPAAGVAKQQGQAQHRPDLQAAQALIQAQQSAAEYGPMYAGLVLVMLPVLILYICVQKNLTQGMTVGGLKG